MTLEYKVVDNKYKSIKEIAKSHFNISDRLLIKLKKQDKILLNNVPTYVTHLVKLGDILEINLDFEEETENIVPKEIDLQIIFEDNSLLVVNKPAGIPVHPSILHYENSLASGIKFYFDTHNIKRKIRPVNRLDKDTSGIVIFAKNEYIQEALIKQMKSKAFEKEYYAILTGFLEETSGIINAPISRKDGSIIEREINLKKGVNAITHFELIRNFEIKNSDNLNIKLSLVKFKLETGRTHQIRLHSKYINHSILGDTLYGSQCNLISRQALHAYKIKFIHPITKENIVLEIELPEDMKKVLTKK